MSGELNLSEVSRLSDLLLPPLEKLPVSVNFYFDSTHAIHIAGKIQGCLYLRCERCLNTMIYPLDITFDLTGVNDIESANSLPNELEPVIIPEDGQIELQTLLEDEIILNLALVPRHDPSECSVKLDAETEVVTTKKIKPFVGLANLMNEEE
jgi:uncharacterized protein